MRWLIVFFCFLLPGMPAGAENLAPVTIETQNGPVKLSLEVAITPKQHEKGLMFRRSIPDRRGMLFLFTPEQDVTMWMKDTLVPLDMLFIDGKGAITRIAGQTTPQSLEYIPSGGPVKAVIEVSGGTAKRYHIAKGDHVLYSLAP